MPLSAWMKKRWFRWLAAFLFWTAIGLFYSSRMAISGRPTSYFDSLRSSLAQWYIWGLLAPLIVFIDRRLPLQREDLFRRVLFHLPLGFTFTAVAVYALEASRMLFGIENSFALSWLPLRMAMRGGFHWYVLVYWAILGIYAAWDYARVSQERQLRAAELERLLAQSRLNTLRSQLHPHFLFNTLNAISAHLERNPRIARRMLEQLGELLRMSLDHAEEQEIPLEDELAFLDRYLALQKVRFEDRLKVEVSCDPLVFDAMVPTFVLQPLVENAIKHGISARSTLGLVRIAAWPEHGLLHLRVTDDGPGLPSNWQLAAHRGVGLSNTVERLQQLYGDAGHRFEIANQPGGGVGVEIALPLHSAAAETVTEDSSYAEDPYAHRG